MSEEDFEAATYPANARLQVVKFQDAELHLTVEPGGHRVVPYGNVVSLHGARIRRESTIVIPGNKAGQIMKAVGSLAVTAATGIPIRVGGRNNDASKDSTRTKEDHQFAIGFRVVEVREVLFLINTSFNFRQALGPDAGYAAEINVRTFVRKLAERCVGARPDEFFKAICEGVALPPAIDSLMEFFRNTKNQETSS